MRDPCHDCGLAKMTFSRFDFWIREIVQDTKDHNCPRWAQPLPLISEATDTAFIREAWNTQEGLAAWRAAL